MNVYESIMSGLNQAVDYSNGQKAGIRVHKLLVEPVDNFKPDEIKLIRNNLNMTQVIFAAILGVSKKTVEAWEQGVNAPSGPASRLLRIFKDHPDSAKILLKNA